MITDINSEDRLVQKTFAEHLHDKLGWDSVYAWNDEAFGPNGTLGRAGEREVVLIRDLRAALTGLNRDLLPGQAPESLLSSLRELLKPMPTWTQNVQTQAEVKVFVLDNLWQSLPRPPFTEQEMEIFSDRVYDYVWQRSASGGFLEAALAG